jgi:hypothetical protein
MNHPIVNTLSIILAVTLFSSCHSGTKKNQPIITATAKEVPEFIADSAFNYVETQTLFGPRIPNSIAHKTCQTYLVKTLGKFGASVIEQQTDLRAFDGTILKSTNIIASFQPEKTGRILLCAHWDSRPWADHDPDPANHKQAVMGANDGASGVGILMEIARLLGATKPENAPSVGVDIVLFDAEDYGYPAFYKGNRDNESWCLGSQYWAKNPHKPDYKAKYGILLDMVGGKAATFYWEYFSQKYAFDVLRKVWGKASSIGYGNLFLSSDGGAVTDDHVFINQLAHIPCINIIDYDPGSDHSFVDSWHTIYDTMDKIDKQTLKAVGETLMQVIYSE